MASSNDAEKDQSQYHGQQAGPRTEASSIFDHDEPDKVESPREDEDLEAVTQAISKASNREVTRTLTTMDWDGPDDPENPLNWPTWKKAYITTIVGLIAFCVAFGSSVYTPAYPEIALHFHVSGTASLLGLTLYVLGLAFGPILAAPISETSGRNVVYRVSMPLSMCFTLGAGFCTKSFGGLLVCRFFAGFFGSAVLAVGAGTNVDLFSPRYRALAASCFLMAPFAGPALGPFVGGFVVQYGNWRWTQWSMLIISGVVYVLSLPMPETYKKIILRRRAAKLGIQATPQGPQGFAAIKFTLMVTLIRPIHMLFVEPIVLFLALYTAFAFSVLFAFFAAFPYVFTRPPYNFSISQNGLVFLAIAIGVVISATTSIVIDRVIYVKQHHKAIVEGKAQAAPEHRLYAAMLGSLGIPVGLFWFGWTADRGVHWVALVLAAIPFAWGNLSLFTATALYSVDVYGPLNGASALAANGIMRYALGGVFPLFTVQMYKKLGIGWATSLLGFISVAMLPIPWVLFKYGPRIRAKSHYDSIKS